MTTWTKMVDITRQTLEILKAETARRWTPQELRQRVSKEIEQPVSLSEIRDAVMRIAARSIVTFDPDGKLRVIESNLSAYSTQEMAPQ